MPSEAGRDIAREAREKAIKYREAVKCLDDCERFSFEDVLKINEIAGNPIEGPKLRQMWDMSMDTIAGKEGFKRTLRDTLIEGIEAFESVAKRIEKQ
jgi:hypothetical protein